MARRSTLALFCAGLAAAAPQGCGDAGPKSLQKVHTAVLSTSNVCVQLHNDVYQRFSGYVAKYRLAELCEGALATLERIRRLLELGCGSGSSVQMAEVGHALAQQLKSLEGQFERMFQATNSMGEGEVQAAMANHLAQLGNHILGAVQQDHVPASTWPALANTVAENLALLNAAAFERVQEGVTYNIHKLEISNIPRFLALLDTFPAQVAVELHRPDLSESSMCAAVTSVYDAQHVFDTIGDPRAWRSPDVSGLLFPRPNVQKLLFTISKSVPLAYTVLAVLPRVQVGAQEVLDVPEYANMFRDTGGHSAASSYKLAEPACNGVGVAYSPPHCLFESGWGSMTFSLSTEPPFDGVLAVSEMSLKGAELRPKPFVQPVASKADSMEKLIEYVDSVYKSLNTPSPDIFFLSPTVGNCLTLQRLGPSRRGPGMPQLTPKLIWVPINPIIPPPWSFAPNFTLWHERWLASRTGEGAGAGQPAGEAVWWFAQCSLQSAVNVLALQGYSLLHVEHTFAVFILKGLWPSVAPMMRGSTLELYDHWLQGWYCSPIAATLFGLEWFAGIDVAALFSRDASAPEKRHLLCDFARRHSLPLSSDAESISCSGDESSHKTHLHQQQQLSQSWHSWELSDPPDERGKAYLLGSAGRGRCLESLGFCECFPPYRGQYCESSQPGRHDASRPYRAVLHYLVGDKERLLADFERTLPILWARFNERFDYPVVVFHDGLRPESRKRILEASFNRIWFAYIDDYTAVPSYLQGRLETEMGGYSIGYRGMCRFRSGRMFMQPVMAHFDYAWTLDTDGYFPAEIRVDPFDRMWHGGHAYGFSHVSRDQASAVQHFWEFCRLYMEMKGLDPKGSRMLRRITDALVLRDTFWHEWNRVLFMNDIEITELTWFRSNAYQDFVSFLDSVGGFWLYRWGDHAVRTIAIALFLDPDRLMKMEVPYGHQNTCVCGAEHPDKVCVRSTEDAWFECIPKMEADGRRDARGDVGTVDESLLFGGE